MIDDIRKRQVEREEAESARKRLMAEFGDSVRSVIATRDGRRLLHWIVYEEGCLQTVGLPEGEARRHLAAAVYNAVDTIEPGAMEEIALEARKQRIADEATIESAIADRRHEYEH